ncbi:MAG TPA: lytic transglycosylase domain-containing protein [Burkholderiales bacterium]|nr:lytic transglycosylase domain-containing protein [Burkholderiales bacterium]
MRKSAFVALGIALWASRLFSASATDLKRIYDPVVRQVAAAHRVPADLIHAIIRAESNYDNFALSEKGAMGLMQLMPETAAQYGVRNVFDAVQNIEGGAKYLKDLIQLYNGQTKLVLAAYNAGQEAVKRYGGRIPNYPETRAYIARVMAAYPKEKTVTRTRIFTVIDASGKRTATNDPDYFRLKKD